MPMTAIAALVVVVLTLLLISLYNRLVRSRNGVENAFASVDVQLKQRCDLIPKLVDSMRAYMTHERGTLDELTALREKASAPGASAAERVARLAAIDAVRRSISDCRRPMRACSSSTDSNDKSAPISWLVFFRGRSSSSLAILELLEAV